MSYQNACTWSKLFLEQNKHLFIEIIPPQDRASQLELHENWSLAVKILGIIWNVKDGFTFKSKQIESHFQPTKRNV